MLVRTMGPKGVDSLAHFKNFKGNHGRESPYFIQIKLILKKTVKINCDLLLIFLFSSIY